MRIGNPYLFLYVLGHVRQRIALSHSTVICDVFVASGKRYRLKRDERDLLRIVHREADHRTDLVVVDAIHERRHEHDLDSCFVDVVDCPHLDIEEIADLAVAVGSVSDTVKLQINVPQTGFGSFAAKLFDLANSMPLVAA